MKNGVTLHGRALARNGLVSLINDRITSTTCFGSTSGSGTGAATTEAPTDTLAPNDVPSPMPSPWLFVAGFLVAFLIIGNLLRARANGPR
jgi:hypothetical protein